MNRRKNCASICLLLLLLTCALVLPACGEKDQLTPEPDPGVTTLIYAQLSENGVDRIRLDKFNKAHKGEVQIEVRDYTQLSEGGRQGVDLLMTEITAGKGPDIIELGASGETSLLPYRRLAEKGYLEDLWPYIETDPGLGRKKDGTLRGVMEAPLQASKVNGGLYAIYEFVQFHTLAGAQSVVGDRTDWTVETLLEIFASMPEGSVILENYRNWADPSVKEHFLASLLYGFSDLFIDWENGRCSFDGEGFRTLLEFTNCLPDQHELGRNCTNRSEASSEHIRRVMDGIVMLEDAGVGVLSVGMKPYEWYFGEADYVGYPVGDGSPGSYFEPLGIKLSMSSACQDKEAAWEYMRQMYYLPENMHDYVRRGISVGRAGYELDLEIAMNDTVLPINGEIVYLGPLAAEDHERFVDLCSRTTRSSLLVDQELVDLVAEVAGAYFAGHKSLDDTVRLIQNRASLYLNEQR